MRRRILRITSKRWQKRHDEGDRLQTLASSFFLPGTGRGARAMAGKAVVDFDFSATLSTSDWLGILKQTLGSKIVAGEGGASLPQAPAESQLNAADKQL